ncbi:MAG: T9SS type A sorting domain-containing protein, partial [Bacteroidia bacterium]|nr:T9SS type A sorting domain-containing protein [Bacteroidia bacterium]
KELQTRNNPNDPVASPFFPKNNEWRKEHIDVTGLLGTGNTFLVSFRNTNNFGNNIFVDDINIYTKTLPAKLKNSGYLISPNPFQNSFVLQHYPGASNLKAIEIYSSTGQLVYRKGFATGTADAYQLIDLSRFASGVYNIRLVYTDKLVTERVIKSN